MPWVTIVFARVVVVWWCGVGTLRPVTPLVLVVDALELVVDPSVVVVEGGSEVDVDVLVVLGVGPGSDGGMVVVVVVDVVLVVEVVVVEVVVVEVVVVQKVVVVGSLQSLTVWSGTLLTTAPFADQLSQFCEP